MAVNPTPADKIDVNGKDAHPLYKYLRAQQPISLPGSQARPNGDIEWNYVKFMINREGQPVKRFKSAFDPIGFEGDVRLLLVSELRRPTLQRLRESVPVERKKLLSKTVVVTCFCLGYTAHGYVFCNVDAIAKMDVHHCSLTEGYHVVDHVNLHINLCAVLFLVVPGWQGDPTRGMHHASWQEGVQRGQAAGCLITQIATPAAKATWPATTAVHIHFLVV